MKSLGLDLRSHLFMHMLRAAIITPSALLPVLSHNKLFDVECPHLPLILYITHIVVLYTR